MSSNVSTEDLGSPIDDLPVVHRKSSAQKKSTGSEKLQRESPSLSSRTIGARDIRNRIQSQRPRCDSSLCHEWYENASRQEDHILHLQQRLMLLAVRLEKYEDFIRNLRTNVEISFVHIFDD